MGWSWRKSVMAGPIRLNFSRSGVGVSAGVRGARVSLGPRGTFIHVGRGGFRYTKRLAGPAPVPSPAAPQPTQAAATPAKALREVEIVDPSRLVSSGLGELLAEIRAKQSKISLTLVLSGAAMLFIALGTGLLLAGTPLWLGLGALALALPAIAFVPRARWRDRRECWVKVHYVLDPLGEKVHESLMQLLALLERTHVVWSVRQAHHHGDWKRNAGAGVSVRRRRVSVGSGPPPRFESNIRIGSLQVGDSRLYFLPDLVLVYDQRSIGAVNYSDLRVEHGTTTFVEDGTVPRDARVIGKTWRYVNKNGTPDRRFSNNYRMPLVSYGQLNLAAPSGLELELQTSSDEAAVRSADLLEKVRSLYRQIESSRALNDTALPPETEAPDEPPPILGLGVVRRVWEVISFDWPSRLPGWSVPIVWGITVAVPLVLILVRLVRGPGAIPIISLTIILLLTGGVLARLLLGILTDRSAGEQGDREARRSRFSALLISELTTRPIQEFDYTQLVAESGLSRREAARAADTVYRRMADRVVEDGVVTDSEQKRLDLLAEALEMDSEHAADLLEMAKTKRYERAVSEALTDGALTEAESKSLSRLRASLDLE